ncbi:MAG: hypothetical protein ACK5YR_23225, partial [Pirellula sp.]
EGRQAATNAVARRYRKPSLLPKQIRRSNAARTQHLPHLSVCPPLALTNTEPIPRKNRSIIRRTTLADQDKTNDYETFSPEERVLMVWPITLTAWRFKEPHGIQQRLSRHVGRVERR